VVPGSARPVNTVHCFRASSTSFACKPRFADTRLAQERHDPALSLDRGLQPIAKRCRMLVAPDKHGTEQRTHGAYHPE
jgi:hypothetical protein